MKLDKNIWDESDFQEMEWHDCKVYAMAFNDEKFELLFDIDYIVKWIKPKSNESNFNFLVSPATLVFKNVWDLNISLESNLNIEIQALSRSNPHAPKNLILFPEAIEYDWKIETTDGEIGFKSIGYKQYFRQPPILTASQRIDLSDRGNISFKTIENNSYSDEVK